MVTVVRINIRNVSARERNGLGTNVKDAKNAKKEKINLRVELATTGAPDDA